MIQYQAVAPCLQPIAALERRILVIVPCGARKIWAGNFLAGPTPAKDAYVSTLFRLHRRYAEAFGSEWRILSAWYGITHPDQLIEDYDARFRASDLHPDSWWRITEMFRQARALGGFDHLVLLGGYLYREIARRAFEGVFLPEQVSEPFAGMDLLRTLRALKLAVAGNPRDVSARTPTDTRQRYEFQFLLGRHSCNHELIDLSRRPASRLSHGAVGEDRLGTRRTQDGF